MAKGNKIMTSLLMNIETSSANLKKGLDDAKGKIGKFSKQAGTQLKGLGNSMKGMIGGALAPITGMFGGILKSVGGIAKGVYTSVIPAFGAMGAAFAATGIGAVIIAIVAAFAAIYTWVKRSVGGAEAWSKVMAYISGVTDAILDRIMMIGNFIWDVVTGSGEARENWKKSKEELNGIVETAEAMVALQERENELWRLQFSYTYDVGQNLVTQKSLMMEIADLSVEVAEQRTIANDSAFTTEERLTAINKALNITKGLEEKKVSIAKENYQLAIERAAQAVNDKEATEGVNDAYIALARAQEARAAATRMMLKKQESLTNKAKKERQEREGINKAMISQIALANTLATSLKKMVPIKPTGLKGVDALPMLPTADEVQKAVDERIEANKEALGRYAVETSEATKQGNQLIQATMQQGIVKFAEGLGTLMSGQIDGMKNFFNQFLDLLFEFGKSFGKILIAIGVAKVALENIGISGIGAIIAGTALVVGMVAIQGLIKKGSGTENAGKQNASGGRPTSIMDTMNERGSEMFSMGNGMYIHNNLDTKQMLGKQQQGIVGVLRGDDMYLQWEETGRRRNNTI